MLESWWGRLGSNQGPIGYEPTALTAELRALESEAPAGITPCGTRGQARP